VQGGTLFLTSPLLGTGATTVNNSGTLAADTDLSGSLLVNAGGIVSPGGAETGLIRSNGLSLSNSAILRFDLGGTTTSDLIELTGGTFTPPTSGQALNIWFCRLKLI
jgi:hypothetical protein